MPTTVNHTALQKVMADVAEYSSPDNPAKLVVASKYASVEQLLELYEAGVRDFGENKIQDALAKKNAFKKIHPPLPNPPPQGGRGLSNVTWHFIGHLQQNKINKLFTDEGDHVFSLIHSVDSIALAEKLSEANLARGLCQPVLLQVNQTQEPQKSGFLPEALDHAASHVLTLKGIQLHGLMAFGHPSKHEDACEAVFSAVSQHAKRLSDVLGHELNVLSMGMSQDYLPALKKGATIIRVGRQLFNDE